MKKSILIIIFLILLSSCGFKVVNQAELSNFNILEISTNGDNKINYIIKNDLLQNSKDNALKSINLNLNTSKTRSIKEKNINNVITKYELKIDVTVKFSILENDENYKFKKSKVADYNATSKYSVTIKNEKKLIDILSADLAEEIFEELLIRINAI